jgi:hypothetical protein
MAVILVSMDSPDKGGQNGGKIFRIGCVLSDPGSLHRRAVAADPTCAEGLASLGAEVRLAVVYGSDLYVNRKSRSRRFEWW